jgi:hypothetical protein
MSSAPLVRIYDANRPLKFHVGSPGRAAAKKLPLPGERRGVTFYSRYSDLDGIHTVLPTSSEYRYSPSPEANDSRSVLSNLLT